MPEEHLPASHVVYGLRVAANLALPGLLPSFDSEIFDVRVWLKDWSTFPSTFTKLTGSLHPGACEGRDDEPKLRVGLLSVSDYFGFLYSDGVRFAVERHGQEVWADWPENYTLEDACTYLLGPVMGFVLRLRGTVCLHASAVALGDRAIALLGLAGAGKSTAAAAFACSGFPVVSDDVVALTDNGERFVVQPGYPRVNLWPDSVVSLFGTEDALPRITPTWEKRYMTLDHNGHCFASKPLPLGAIYILDHRDMALTAAVVEEVSGEKAFMALVANTYVNYLLDQDMRRKEFDVLCRVISDIPIRRVRPPAEPSAIFRLCEAIAADARRVMTQTPASAIAGQG